MLNRTTSNPAESASPASPPIRRHNRTQAQLSAFAILAGQLGEAEPDADKLNVLSQLAKLAEAPENKRAIMLDKMTLPRLLAFADPAQPLSLRKQAMRALAGLCSEELNQESLWEQARYLILAAAQPTEGMGFGSFSLRRHAYWALVNVSTDNPAVQERIWADDGDDVESTDMPSTREVVLTACEEGEEEEIRVQALWILSNLTCLVANKALMWNDDRTRAILLDCAAESSPEAVRIQALRALAGLAYDGGYRKADERPQLTPRRRDVLLECASEVKCEPVRREAARALRFLGISRHQLEDLLRRNRALMCSGNRRDSAQRREFLRQAAADAAAATAEAASHSNVGAALSRAKGTRDDGSDGKSVSDAASVAPALEVAAPAPAPAPAAAAPAAAAPKQERRLSFSEDTGGSRRPSVSNDAMAAATAAEASRAAAASKAAAAAPPVSLSALKTTASKLELLVRGGDSDGDAGGSSSGRGSKSSGRDMSVSDSPLPSGGRPD